jgi:hypothetical protein
MGIRRARLIYKEKPSAEGLRSGRNEFNTKYGIQKEKRKKESLLLLQVQSLQVLNPENFISFQALLILGYS